MFETMRSAGSTSSEAPRFSRRRVKKSLADELDGEFEDVSLSPADSLGQTESPMDSHDEITEDDGRAEDVVPEDHELPTAFPSPSTSPTIADADSVSLDTLVGDKEDQPATKPIENAMEPPRKSNFIEQISPVESASQQESHKERTKFMASMRNRKLIGRNTDGFFNMETMPTITDVQRRVQQSKGIAALQRTLAPPPLSDTASSSTGSSHSSSSTTANSVKHPSTLRQVTFAEPKGRKPNKVQGPYPYTASRRPQGASRFSLARNLIAAGHRKKLSQPSAPARFVKLPTDPVVTFKRKFGDFGLKVTIPEPELDEYEGGDSGSITSLPDVDSAGGFTFRSPKLEFGVPRAFIPNQCLEPSCPIRFAHVKGPYHHKGHRHNKIMTGLFGHSNPPPEIWNAYRNMVHLTCDGEVISPDGRPGSEAQDDLVIAFAMFHYGELNGMGGEEFHRRYAGKHLSSRIAIRSSSTNSSKGSCE